MNVNEILNNIQFSNENSVLYIPCSLMALDILSGVIHAWQTGHLKSYRMRDGLGRKAGEVIVLIIGELFAYGLLMPMSILKGFSLYIIFMEMVSILENLQKMGFKVPKFVEKALGEIDERIQNRNSGDENNDGKGTG